MNDNDGQKDLKKNLTEKVFIVIQTLPSIKMQQAFNRVSQQSSGFTTVVHLKGKSLAMVFLVSWIQLQPLFLAVASDSRESCQKDPET